MAGKWFGLIIVFVIVMVGLTASAVFLNWLTAAFFGGGKPAAQQAQMSEEDVRKQRGEERRQKKEKREEKQKEDAAKNRAEREREAKFAKADVPKPLTESEYSPKTGKIVWPQVLLSSHYQKPRERLEQLLRERAASPDAKPSSAAHTAAQQMFSLHKENIRVVPTNEYMAARKFLESLIQMLRP